MLFSYHLLEIPPFILLMIIMGAFAVVGVVGTYCFRKFNKLGYRKSHNEMVGYIFGILGGFYGLLMGFVVFVVWDSLNSAQTNANKEGSLARGLYKDIKYYPDSVVVKPLMTTYMLYVHSVVEQEYPDMEQMKPMTKVHRKYFNEVFREIEKLDARDPRVEQMFRHLNELATFRSLRQLDGAAEIPAEIWIALLIGAAIIMLLAMIIDVESLRLHLAVNGLLAAFIGLVIYLIIILDHPFTGKMKIEPLEFQTILKMVDEDV